MFLVLTIYITKYYYYYINQQNITTCRLPKQHKKEGSDNKSSNSSYVLPNITITYISTNKILQSIKLYQQFQVRQSDTRN